MTTILPVFGEGEALTGGLWVAPRRTILDRVSPLSVKAYVYKKKVFDLLKASVYKKNPSIQFVYTEQMLCEEILMNIFKTTEATIRTPMSPEKYLPFG